MTAAVRERILARRARFMALTLATAAGACASNSAEPCLAPPTCEDDERRGILPTDNLAGASTLCIGERADLHVARRCRFGQTRTITSLSCTSSDASVIAVEPGAGCTVRATGAGVATVTANGAAERVSNETLTLTVYDCADAGDAAPSDTP